MLWQIGILSLTLLACCMICHGELVRIKPPARRLTSFYLMVALGGALGGLFVNFAAPRLYSGFWEFHIGLFMTLLAFGLRIFTAGRSSSGPGSSGVRARCGWVPGGAGLFLHRQHSGIAGRDDRHARNFYGVLRVVDSSPDPDRALRSLLTGRSNMATSFSTPHCKNGRRRITVFSSGIHLACKDFPRRATPPSVLGRPDALSIGIVGLGAGTSALVAGPYDRICFYEINPNVIDIAQTYFTYLKESLGNAGLFRGTPGFRWNGNSRRIRPGTSLMCWPWMPSPATPSPSTF